MNIENLAKVAKKLVESPKGILAIDESTSTSTGRFEKANIPPTEENRRTYRNLLITAPEIERYISGMIMTDETIRQKSNDGKLFTEIFKSKGMEIGIKVDAGPKDLPFHSGEKMTEGLDGLRARLQEYKKLGASFAKWRAMFYVSDTMPSAAAISVNTNALARYAALCQECDIVPIVEPEVMMDGDHSISQDSKVIATILDSLFKDLEIQGVDITGIILKTGMAISGADAKVQASPLEIANETIKVLTEHVPANIAGIVFLSGGQDEETATINLNAMHVHGNLPWPLTFSYGRAIQNPAFTLWAKDITGDVAAAQLALVDRARANNEANLGTYTK